MEADQVVLFAQTMTVASFWCGVLAFVACEGVKLIVGGIYSALRRRGARKPFRRRVEAGVANHEFAARVLRARLERE